MVFKTRAVRGVAFAGWAARRKTQGKPERLAWFCNAADRPQNHAPSGSNQNGPFAHQTPCVCYSTRCVVLAVKSSRFGLERACCKPDREPPGFLEQVTRPGFAFKGDAAERGSNPFMFKGLKGRSARIVVTMGMPALVYRWYFRARGVGLLKRNILGFVGISPVRDTLVGMVDKLGEAGVRKWQDKLRALGARAV